MAQKKVKVTVAMNPPVLLVDYSRDLKLNGNALVRVEASSSLKSFASIDVVTLLNVSHSMSCAAASPSETPSRLDLLKKAIKFIIRQLGDDDRLAIVAFNDQVIKEYSTDLLETSGGNLMALEDKVDSLMAKGDTAFRSSLEHAVQVCVNEPSYSVWLSITVVPSTRYPPFNLGPVLVPSTKVDKRGKYQIVQHCYSLNNS
jgi:hypothetical protein